MVWPCPPEPENAEHEQGPRRLNLTCDSDVQGPAAGQAVAVVRRAVVAARVAPPDSGDLQLCSPGALTLAAQTLPRVLSVPGERGVPCAFSHGADEDQTLPCQQPAPLGLGL